MQTFIKEVEPMLKVVFISISIMIIEIILFSRLLLFATFIKQIKPYNIYMICLVIQYFILLSLNTFGIVYMLYFKNENKKKQMWTDGGDIVLFGTNCPSSNHN